MQFGCITPTNGCFKNRYIFIIFDHEVLDFLQQQYFDNFWSITPKFMIFFNKVGFSKQPFVDVIQPNYMIFVAKWKSGSKVYVFSVFNQFRLMWVVHLQQKSYPGLGIRYLPSIWCGEAPLCLIICSDNFEPT